MLLSCIWIEDFTLHLLYFQAKQGYIKIIYYDTIDLLDDGLYNAMVNGRRFWNVGCISSILIYFADHTIGHDTQFQDSSRDFTPCK